MRSKKKINALAKQFAQKSFDGATGVIDREYVRAVIEVIQEFQEAMRSLLLKQYQYFLEMEQINRMVQIEYVSDCDVSKIHAQMEHLTNQKLQLMTVIVPELIAGIRITLGDQVWERSVRGDLEAICRA
ncbi:MAG: F0F1 ATP synthase subunit delta [Puniceicoccales bacterium]|jgi:F0F1-type ATP synthase delta subunit|nr:F0F1 ATP synthase subunit delta [Puniceicoccales bacterium]